MEERQDRIRSPASEGVGGDRRRGDRFAGWEKGFAGDGERLTMEDNLAGNL